MAEATGRGLLFPVVPPAEQPAEGQEMEQRPQQESQGQTPVVPGQSSRQVSPPSPSLPPPEIVKFDAETFSRHHDREHGQEQGYERRYSRGSSAGDGDDVTIATIDTTRTATTTATASTSATTAVTALATSPPQWLAYDDPEYARYVAEHDPERGSVGRMSHFSTGLSVDSDADSAMGDMSSPLSTTSLRSSIYDYVEEYGRTFHRYKQGKYWMPNDKNEQERLDLQHAVFMQLLRGKLGLAPIKDPQSVLDLGTGTGIWAIEFATQHPSADVLGTDLSPIQPEYVPPNCHFEVDDAEDDWVFGRPFDYIHLRLMFHAFRSHPTVIRSAFENLNPGGWMEWQDYYCHLQAVDGTMAGTALERWTRLYIEGGQRLGRDMLAPRKYKRWMEEAGFVNVTEQKLVIPGNPWPKGKELKALGLWQMTNFLDGIHAVTMTIFTKGLGMSPEAVELLLVDVRKDIKNLGVHFYFLTYIVYGQKPYDRTPPGHQ
ncbi:S-adenosyl-L-methionine-dependent methyltransferase [Diplogelasinospora grovesii]|uniref:S-adenosyl-L-methionine-dependent methyltransferase n=1 Tax=Diplogelasinospora grovesii TaxID=303347 RepID=A0AAN6N3N8_9PEZI|nr:S-adenosyl-L-methionine-dependent methyltransferase [Diplogelasinospora grovesii]